MNIGLDRDEGLTRKWASSGDAALNAAGEPKRPDGLVGNAAAKH